MLQLGRCGCRADAAAGRRARVLFYPVASLLVFSYFTFLPCTSLTVPLTMSVITITLLLITQEIHQSNLPPTPTATGYGAILRRRATVQLSTFMCASQQKESEFWNDEWGLQLREMLVHTMYPLSPCVQKYSSNWATSWLVYDGETPEKKMFTKAHRT